MTRKDFEAIAEAVAMAREELHGDQAPTYPVLATSEWAYIFNRVEDNLIRALRKSNEAFDAERFKKACRACRA